MANNCPLTFSLSYYWMSIFTDKYVPKPNRKAQLEDMREVLQEGIEYLKTMGPLAEQALKVFEDCMERLKRIDEHSADASVAAWVKDSTLSFNHLYWTFFAAMSMQRIEPMYGSISAIQDIVKANYETFFQQVSNSFLPCDNTITTIIATSTILWRYDIFRQNVRQYANLVKEQESYILRSLSFCGHHRSSATEFTTNLRELLFGNLDDFCEELVKPWIDNLDSLSIWASNHSFFPIPPMEQYALECAIFECTDYIYRIDLVRILKALDFPRLLNLKTKSSFYVYLQRGVSSVIGKFRREWMQIPEAEWDTWLSQQIPLLVNNVQQKISDTVRAMYRQGQSFVVRDLSFFYDRAIRFPFSTLSLQNGPMHTPLKPPKSISDIYSWVHVVEMISLHVYPSSQDTISALSCIKDRYLSYFSRSNMAHLDQFTDKNMSPVELLHDLAKSSRTSLSRDQLIQAAMTFEADTNLQKIATKICLSCKRRRGVRLIYCKNHSLPLSHAQICTAAVCVNCIQKNGAHIPPVHDIKTWQCPFCSGWDTHGTRKRIIVSNLGSIERKAIHPSLLPEAKRLKFGF